MTALPQVDPDAGCINCGMCVANCPGQAIFLVDEHYSEDSATVTLPYEFLPLPKKGDAGVALSRGGSPVCDAEVVAVRKVPAFDQTALVTIKVPKDFAGTARFFKAGEENVG